MGAGTETFMRRADEDDARASLVPTSGSGLASRSEALVLRGVRDLEAQIEAPTEYKLGVQFEFGATRSLAAAAVHYRKAANLGHIAAQCVLSALYETGVGVEQNQEEAARWFARFREATAKWWQTSVQEAGSGYAMCLADFCHRGHGIAKDGEERWLGKANDSNSDCERGDAFYHLGMEYSGARTIAAA
jgi:hypothetical protein